jgi:dienelactone hydrolase
VKSISCVLVVLLAAACSSGDDSPGAASATTGAAPAATLDSAPDGTDPTETTAPAATSVGSSTRPTTTPSSTTPATTAPTTGSEPTPSAGSGADVLGERGPYPVGVTTLQIPDGPFVEAWYPAADGTTGTDTYDARDFVPAAVRALLTADVPATYTIEAGRDADLAAPPPGGFPLAAYSHGFSGFRVVSSFLTSHLASWGIVVVAPDHPARDLSSQLGGGPTEPSEPVDDLRGSVDLALDHFGDAIDGQRIAVFGHSAGGPTALALAAADDRVRGYALMASGMASGTDDEPPEVPSFHLAGAVDAIVDPETRSRATFEAAVPPTRFWLIDATGHGGFTDLCTYGNGTGIIGVADASGLGPVLDAQPQLRTLGEDGCIPPAAPVEAAHPIIRHGMTAWLIETLEVETDVPTALGPEIAELYELGVEVAARD